MSFAYDDVEDVVGAVTSVRARIRRRRGEEEKEEEEEKNPVDKSVMMKRPKRHESLEADDASRLHRCRR